MSIFGKYNSCLRHERGSMNAAETKKAQKPIKLRPFGFQVLAFSLLFFSLAGWLRLQQSIYQWRYLIKYAVQPPPWYSASSGALLGVAAALGLAALWLRLPWSKRYLQISLPLLSAGWWMDYLLFTHSSTAFANWLFRLLATMLYLGFVYFYLHYAPAMRSIGVKREK